MKKNAAEFVTELAEYLTKSGWNVELATERQHRPLCIVRHGPLLRDQRRAPQLHGDLGRRLREHPQGFALDFGGVHIYPLTTRASRSPSTATPRSASRPTATTTRSTLTCRPTSSQQWRRGHRGGSQRLRPEHLPVPRLRRRRGVGHQRQDRQVLPRGRRRGAATAPSRSVCSSRRTAARRTRNGRPHGRPSAPRPTPSAPSATRLSPLEWWPRPAEFAALRPRS